MSHEHDEHTKSALAYYRKHLNNARELLAKNPQPPENYYPMRDALDAFSQLIHVAAGKWQKNRAEVLEAAANVAGGIVSRQSGIAVDSVQAEVTRIAVQIARKLVAEVDRE